MATSEAALKKVEDQLCCLVCLDTYTNPKQLACNHIFCKQCLARLVTRDPQGSLHLRCPSCRQVTSIRERGVAGLKSAYEISKVVEILKSHRQCKENVPHCSIHQRQLELHCETCDKQLICLQCAVEEHCCHHYSIIPVSEEQSNTESLKAFRTPVLTMNKVRKPYGVAVGKKGEVVVTEWSVHRVLVLNPYGERLASFGSYGSDQGQFKYPCGVAVDREGNIFVTDFENHRIQKFSQEGQFLASAGSEGDERLQFHYPIGIAINAAKDKLYVTDSWNERVQILNSDLSFYSMFHTRGCKRGRFKYPQGIACDPAGKVYVSDSSNNHVEVFTAQGKLLRRFGRLGVSKEELQYPVSLCVGGGNVYISECDASRVSVFTTEGEFLTSFGRKGSGAGEFRACCGVAVDHSGGVLYVCDRENNNIHVYLKP